MNHIQEKIAEQRDKVAAQACALTEQQRNLLVDELLYRIHRSHEQLVELLRAGDTSNAFQVLAATESAVSLAGVTVESIRGDHEDWTTNSDSKVDSVIESWVTMVLEVGKTVLESLGLPEDVLNRLREGKPTDADLQIVREAAAREGVTITNDMPEPAQAQATNTDSSGFGFGQYL